MIKYCTDKMHFWANRMLKMIMENKYFFFFFMTKVFNGLEITCSELKLSCLHLPYNHGLRLQFSFKPLCLIVTILSTAQ